MKEFSIEISEPIEMEKIEKKPKKLRGPKKKEAKMKQSLFE